MSLTEQVAPIRSWREYVERVATEFTDGWHFRGVLDGWDLEPSLQRLAGDWNIELSDLPRLERRLLREFKRAYPADGAEPAPSDEDTLGWLALMQHYGAPTRLVDWTYSPFTAAFFALDHLLSARKADCAAVWALSVKPFAEEKIHSYLRDDLHPAFKGFLDKRDGKSFECVFMKANPPAAFVSTANPYKLHQRLVVQQGVFLCPGDITKSFEDNLRELPGATDEANLKKILFHRDVLKEAFDGLRRMNITHSSLFPGVDGYSRSLRHRAKFFLGDAF